MTKKDNWNANDEKKYYWLFNYLKKTNSDIDEYSYIDDNKRKLMSIVQNNENWSDSSKEALLFMIAKYLRTTTNNKNNDRYAKLYSQAGYDIMIENRKKEHENKQDDKELINYRDHDYFINILNNIDYNNIKTLTSHFQYLLLSLLTLQPPLRTSYYLTSKFINSFFWKKSDFKDL